MNAQYGRTHNTEGERESVCVCVCVCEREREREGESVCVCIGRAVLYVRYSAVYVCMYIYITNYILGDVISDTQGLVMYVNMYSVYVYVYIGVELLKGLHTCTEVSAIFMKKIRAP